MGEDTERGHLGHLTPAHRDVARLAEDISAGVDGLGGQAGKFIREYVRSRGNPQSAARDLAIALAEHAVDARVQWLILDDYHELHEAREAEEFLREFQVRVQYRSFVTARSRPSWATARRGLYGEIFEIDRADLAMDEDESKLILGGRTDLLDLISRAEGWPAVLGLAAGISRGNPPANVMPTGLYDYFAEELYGSAAASVQEALLTLALAPELTEDAIPTQRGGRAGEAIRQIRDLGFLSTEQDAQLHPLVRAFLLQKLAAEPDAQVLATEAVFSCLQREKWDRAFAAGPTIRPCRACRTGPGSRLQFPHQVRASWHPLRVCGCCQDWALVPSAAVDLVDAELALRNGATRLARDLASRLSEQLHADHPLASKASRSSRRLPSAKEIFPQRLQRMSRRAHARAMIKMKQTRYMAGPSPPFRANSATRAG